MLFEFYWLNELHDAVDNFLVFIKTTRPEDFSAVRVCDANSGNAIFLFAATEKGQSTALNYSTLMLNNSTTFGAVGSAASLIAVQIRRLKFWHGYSKDLAMF